jgi:sugar phosphate isomerase/epimerase
LPHLTLGHLTVSADPLETIDVAAATGFRSVSIRIAPRKKGEPFFRQILGNGAALKELRQRLDDTGLRLSSAMPHQLFDDTTQDDLKRFAEAAFILKPDYILCNDYLSNDGIIDLLPSFAVDLGGAGISMALEFTRYSQTRSLAHTLQRISQLGQPNIRVLIDSLHLNRSGGTNAEVAATPREQLALVQLCDAKRLDHRPSDEELLAEARTARLAPGEGGLDLVGFLDSLRRDVEIEYEVPHPADKDLPPLEKARRAYKAFRSYLDSYAGSRGFAYDWAPAKRASNR